MNLTSWKMIFRVLMAISEIESILVWFNRFANSLLSLALHNSTIFSIFAVVRAAQLIFVTTKEKGNMEINPF